MDNVGILLLDYNCQYHTRRAIGGSPWETRRRKRRKLLKVKALITINTRFLKQFSNFTFQTTKKNMHKDENKKL